MTDVKQQPAAAGEEIMVNTPYDVFILPLRPSGLDGKGPRFVVHVPAPQRESVTVRYDLSPAQTESSIRDALIRMGWTPPEDGPVAVCEECGEPVSECGCYPKSVKAERDALRERVGQLEYSNAVNADAKAQAAKHAEEVDRLRERVKELIGIIDDIRHWDISNLSLDIPLPLRKRMQTVLAAMRESLESIGGKQ